MTTPSGSRNGLPRTGRAVPGREDLHVGREDVVDVAKPVVVPVAERGGEGWIEDGRIDRYEVGNGVLAVAVLIGALACIPATIVIRIRLVGVGEGWTVICGIHSAIAVAIEPGHEFQA